MDKKPNKKQKEFLRSLANYSALGGALIGSMNQAQATIQYATLSGTPVSNADVVIGVPAGSLLFRDNPGINSVLAYIGGGLSVSGAVSSFFPDALNGGVAVSAAGAWNVPATQFLAYQGGPTGGNFINTSGKFMAFRFNDGGIKYGWIRFDVSSDASSFTLIDWAYEDDGSSILTGQTAPLPIELLSFDAKSFQNAVDLLWETANEINFEGFSLERAEEGAILLKLPGYQVPVILMNNRRIDIVMKLSLRTNAITIA